MNQVSQVGLSLLGYNRGQVEKLIEEKNLQIKALEQTIADLSEKIIYYESIEQELKDSIVDARITGNRIVADSNVEAERLVNQTNRQIAGFREEFALQSHALLNTGGELRKRMKDMQSDMLAILNEYQEMLSATDFDALYPDQVAQRFDMQLDTYEQDELIFHSDTSKEANMQEVSMSEEEKKELQKLIHEVIANELDSSVDNDDIDVSEAGNLDEEKNQMAEKVSGSDSVEDGANKKLSSVHFLPNKRK